MALTDNLVAYYSLEDTSDATGNGNTLTNSGSTTFTTGHVGNAADFGTTNTSKGLYIDSNDAVIGYTQYGTAWTIQTWIYLQGAGTRTMQGVQVQSGSNQRRNHQLYCDSSNGLRINFFGNSGFDISTGFTITTATWTHIIMSYNGTRFQVVVNDGTPFTSTRSVAPSSTASLGGFSIGNTRQGGVWGGNWFESKVDEVGVWQREITAAEITELYNAGAGLSYADITGGSGGYRFVPQLKPFGGL